MKCLFKLLSICISVSLIIVIVAFAHPGSLDSNGGHWDRKNGEYHFHEGKNSSSENSYNSNYVYPNSDFTPPYNPPEDNPYTSQNKKVDRGGSLSTIVSAFLSIPFALIFAIIFITSICSIIYENLLEKHFPKWKLSQYEQVINKFTLCIQEVKECEITIKSQSPTYTIPREYEIGADDLPKIKGTGHWGDIFTVYSKGFKGQKIHVKFNCSGATTRHHIYYYYKCNLAEILCKRCSSKYDVPDLKWYEEYLKYQSAPKRYNFLLGKQKQLKQELLFWHQKCNSSFFSFLIFFHGKHTDKRKELNITYSQALNFEKKPAPQSKSGPLEQASLDDFL